MTDNIILERNERGPFKDFFDFATRMYAYKLSETQLTKLIDAGAMDEFSPSRASMLSSVRNAMQFAELNYSADGQMNLGIAAMIAPDLAKEYDDPLENLDKEYEALGIMLSSNPLDYKQDLIKAKNVTPIADIPPYGTVTICGIIKNKKIIRTKKGTSMAFIKLYDQTGEVESTIFPSLFETSNSILDRNKIVVMKGRFDGKGQDISFVTNEVELLED